MDITRAKEILIRLADGTDTFTGEVLSKESPFNNPETIRALFHALNGLDVLEERQKKRGPTPENAGKPWSEKEDERLAAEFDNGQKIGRIARAHGRSDFAIESRLAKIGKINMPSVVMKK